MGVSRQLLKVRTVGQMARLGDGPQSTSHRNCLSVLCVSCAILAMSSCAALRGSRDAGGVAERLAEWEYQLAQADTEQCAAIIASLLSSPEPEALEVLRRVLTWQGRSALRLAVLAALGARRDDRLIEAVIACLEAPEAPVRKAAHAALLGMDSRRAFRLLVAEVSNRHNSPLKRLGIISVMASRGDLEFVPILVALLDDAHPQVRQATLEGLQEITVLTLPGEAATWRKWWQEARKSRLQLLEALVARQRERLREERSAATRALLESLRPERNPDPAVLILALKCPYPEVQAYAARELGRLKAEAAVPELVRLTEHVHPGVREAALAALGQIGSAAAVEVLLARVDDAVPEVRREAVIALGHLRGGGPPVSRLIDVLEDRHDESLAILAARALGEIDDKQAVAPLAKVVADPTRSRELREEAAVALGRLKDKAAFAALVTALEDPADRLRWAAVDSLGRLEIPEAVPFLARVVVEDTNAQVREAAVVGLGRVGSDGAVKALLKALRDLEGRVAEQAQVALLHLGGQRAEFFQRCAEDLAHSGHFHLAAQLLTSASARMPPDQGASSARGILLREAADMFFRAGAWHEARKAYLEVAAAAARDEPRMREWLERAAACARNANHWEGLLEVSRRARSLVPAVAELWWQGTQEALEALFAAGKYGEVMKHIDELARSEPELGGGAVKNRLLDLRRRAEEAQKGTAQP